MPRILLIDDNLPFLKALVEHMQERAAEIVVDTAITPDEALLLIAVNEYDAIISDFRMPLMDGLTLLKETKALRPDTPVVLITGHGDRDLETQAARQGAYAFLHKPLDGDALISVVHRAVSKHSLPGLTLPSERRDSADESKEIAEKTERILRQVKKRNEQLRMKIQALTAGLDFLPNDTDGKTPPT